MEVRGAYYHSIKRVTFSKIFHRFFLITNGAYEIIWEFAVKLDGGTILTKWGLNGI